MKEGGVGFEMLSKEQVFNITDLAYIVKYTAISLFRAFYWHLKETQNPSASDNPLTTGFRARRSLIYWAQLFPVAPLRLWIYARAPHRGLHL